MMATPRDVPSVSRFCPSARGTQEGSPSGQGPQQPPEEDANESPSRARPILKKPGGGTEDVIYSLQHRVAEETGEKEGVKMEMGFLKKLVDGYRRRLVGLVQEDPAPGPFKLAAVDLIDGLNADLHERLVQSDGTLDGRISPRGNDGRTAEQLRKALQEAQRRVESLLLERDEMLRQAEANDELINSLQAAKEQNKRLLEQIRAQNEEIGTLTQQRLADQEYMEQIMQDGRTRLSGVIDAAETKYKEMQHHLQTKIRAINEGQHTIQAEARDLRVQLDSMKKLFLKHCDSFRGELDDVGHAMTEKMLSVVEHHVAIQEDLRGQIDQLNETLQNEQQGRQEAESLLNQQQAGFDEERRLLNQRLEGEREETRLHLAAIDTAAKTERKATQAERARWAAEMEDAARQKASLEAVLANSQRDLQRMHNDITAINERIQEKENEIVDMISKVRIAEENAATADNEAAHLRAMLAESRMRYQRENEEALRVVRQEHDETVIKLQDLREHDNKVSTAQIEDLEAELANRDVQGKRAQQQVAALEAEKLSNTRDLVLWKAQYEAAHRSRQDVERELSELRQVLAKERMSVEWEKTQHHREKDTWVAELADRADEISELRVAQQDTKTSAQHEVVQLKQKLQSSETEASEAVSRSAKMHKDLAQLKLDLQQAMQARNSAEQELSLEQRQHAEQRELHQIEAKAARAAKQEAKEAVANLTAEQARCRELRLQGSMERLRQVQEEMARERAESTRKVDQLTSQLDEATREVHRLRMRVQEEQSKAFRLRHSSPRSGGVSPRATQEDYSSTPMTSSRRHEQPGDMERRKADLSSAEQQNARLRGEYDRQMQDAERRFHDAIQDTLDDIARENQQLKGLMGETHHQSAGGDFLDAELRRLRQTTTRQ